MKIIQVWRRSINERFPAWFSIGFHVDFTRRYFEIHLYNYVITFGHTYFMAESVKERRRIGCKVPDS